jgi:hypothetical protein
MMDAHSSICGPSPCHLIRIVSPKIADYGNFENDVNWNTYVKDVFDLWCWKLSDWNVDLKMDDLLNFRPRNGGALLRWIYEREVLGHKKSIGFIKEVRAHQFHPFIDEYFGNPFYLHLVRDPRDMALSWSQSPVHRGDVIRASKVWHHDQEGALSIAEALGHRYFRIRYEDLIALPEQTLKAACDHIQVTYQPTMLEFFKNKSVKEQSTKTDNWKNLSEGVLSANSMKFIKTLSPDQIKYIEHENAELMEIFHYDRLYPRISERDYNDLNALLSPLERYEKPAFDEVSAGEKQIRKN